MQQELGLIDEAEINYISLIKHKDSMVNRYLKLADGSYSDSIRPSLLINRDLSDLVGRKYLINNSKKNF